MAELIVEAEDIEDVKVVQEAGKATEWTVVLNNANNKYGNSFQIGDDMEIQMGYGVEYKTVVRGYLYDINDTEEGTLELSGFDWQDYLLGPIVDKEYYDVDWGYILKDLINSYCGDLDVSAVVPIGTTTGGLTVYRNITLWDVVQDIESKSDRMVKITPDKKVYFDPKSDEPKYGIRDGDAQDISLKTSRSTMVNRVIAIGDYERITDSFLEASLRSENWEVISGTWETTTDLNLKHSGAASGVLLTKISAYGTTTTTLVKQSTQPYEVSIYARTKSDLSEGYRLRLWHDGTNYLLNIYKEPNDTLLGSYTLNSTEIGLIQGLSWIGVEFEVKGASLKGYLEGNERLSVTDYTWEVGKGAFQAPANRDTIFDYINIDTDTPLFAISEDATLINKFGQKTLVIKRPETSLKTELQRVADLELAKRMYEASTGSMSMDGNTDVENGDLLTMYIHEPNVFDKDYRVIGVEQHYTGRSWTTNLGLVEKIPMLEEVLRYLAREEIKRIEAITLPKSLTATDQMPSLPSEEALVYLERNNIGNCRIGYTMKVSAFGGA
jgi:hypothetical protein